MKKGEVKVGGRYLAKVSGRMTEVELLQTLPRGGWLATNLRTGRTVRIKTAGRLTQVKGN